MEFMLFNPFELKGSIFSWPLALVVLSLQFLILKNVLEIHVFFSISVNEGHRTN